MSSDESSCRPVEIELDRTRELRITWSDGRACVYPLALLRRSCPCAACREARRLQTGPHLPVVRTAAEQHEMALARKAELVGHYALRITWGDGHAAGIYDYGLLRSLCPEDAASGSVS
jgi:DUF971 family protein